MAKSRLSSSPGQALLIVLLVMAVVVTTGLSVISRTISDVTVTTGQEDSLRAFSAAEAGIEEAIVSNLSIDDPPTEKVIESAGEPTEIKYTASVDRFPEAARDYPYPSEIASGETATIWLVEHDDSGNLNYSQSYTGNKIDIFWGKPNTLIKPALEISVLYLDSATGKLQIGRAIADPESNRTCTSGDENNCFTFDKQNPPHHNQTTLGTGTEAKEYRYLLSLAFRDLDITFNEDTLIALNIRLLYNSDTKQILGVSGQGAPANLPSQGTAIESVGSSGEAARKVRVYQLYPTTPTIFDSAVFSKSGIIK